MLVDDSHSIDQVYVCKSIGDEYRQVRAPHCDRSHLENFGQLSNHLGADHILFVPDLHPCGTRSYDAAVPSIS